MDIERIGSYRFTRPLGQGSTGRVFLARHEASGRRVAVKVLHPELLGSKQLLARFLNEARALSLVAHPGVAAIHEYGQLADGTAYLVMEYLPGLPLSRHLSALFERPQRAARLGLQIASALAAAHRQGIVHRDLKPANVVVTPDPDVLFGERARLFDFGLALLPPAVDADAATQVQTRIGTYLGTPAYMAPEQCRGTGAVTDRADVYSLGVLLFRMLAGRPPFASPSPIELMAKHLYEEPPRLEDLRPGLPADLRSLVMEMLRKDPAARPAMEEVVRRLQRPALGRPAAPVAAMPTEVVFRAEPAEVLPRTRPRLPPVLLAGTVLLLLMILTGWVALAGP